MKKPTLILSGLCLTLLAGNISASDLLPGDPQRGEQLHAKHCTSCHAQQFGGDGSAMYSRPGRKVNTIEALMGQVAFCIKATGAPVSEAQEDDLVHYLNRDHYRLEVAK